MYTSVLVADLLSKLYNDFIYRQMQTSDLMIYVAVVPDHLHIEINILL